VGLRADLPNTAPECTQHARDRRWPYPWQDASGDRPRFIGVLLMQSHGSKSAAHPGISVCCSLLLDGGNHMSGGVSGCGNLDQYIDSRETSSNSVTMKVVIITMYV
jgi:hypothetical protein